MASILKPSTISIHPSRVLILRIVIRKELTGITSTISRDNPHIRLQLRIRVGIDCRSLDLRACVRSGLVKWCIIETIEVLSVLKLLERSLGLPEGLSDPGDTMDVADISSDHSAITFPLGKYLSCVKCEPKVATTVCKKRPAKEKEMVLIVQTALAPRLKR